MRSTTLIRVVVATTLAISSTLTWAPPVFRPPPPRPIPHPIPHSFPYKVPPIGHPGPDVLGTPPHTAPGKVEFEDIFGTPEGEQSIRLKDILDKIKQQEDQAEVPPRLPPETLPEDQHAKVMLEQARRSGAPEDVLSAIAAQEDQFVKRDDLACCLFKRPWMDWPQHAKRKEQEAVFAQMMATEQMAKHTVQVMVVSDASHVAKTVFGDQGIPIANRARSTEFTSMAEITAEMDFLAGRAGGDIVELFLLAKHEDGHVVLTNGKRIPVDDLRAEARSKGIDLRFWGCESGLVESAGILESFDVLPLLRSISRLLRSPESFTRAQFHNTLHRDTGLKFTFDVLEYVAEGKRLEATVVQRKTVEGTETLVEVGTFDLGAPRGYTGPGALTTTNMAASAEAPAASAPMPAPAVVVPSVADATPIQEESARNWLAYAVLVGGLGVIGYAVHTRRARPKASRT
jgi:hypothetical protein